MEMALWMSEDIYPASPDHWQGEWPGSLWVTGKGSTGKWGWMQEKKEVKALWLSFVLVDRRWGKQRGDWESWAEGPGSTKCTKSRAADRQAHPHRLGHTQKVSTQSIPCDLPLHKLVSSFLGLWPRDHRDKRKHSAGLMPQAWRKNARRGPGGDWEKPDPKQLPSRTAQGPWGTGWRKGTLVGSLLLIDFLVMAHIFLPPCLPSKFLVD